MDKRSILTCCPHNVQWIQPLPERLKSYRMGMEKPYPLGRYITISPQPRHIKTYKSMKVVNVKSDYNSSNVVVKLYLTLIELIGGGDGERGLWKQNRWGRLMGGWGSQRGFGRKSQIQFHRGMDESPGTGSHQM